MTKNAAQLSTCRRDVGANQVFVQCKGEPIGSVCMHGTLDDRNDATRVRGEVTDGGTTLTSGLAKDKCRFVSKRPRRAGDLHAHPNDRIDSWRTMAERGR
jgi:hypothetical protein